MPSSLFCEIGTGTAASLRPPPRKGGEFLALKQPRIDHLLPGLRKIEVGGDFLGEFTIRLGIQFREFQKKW
ncbi:hypothetical protein LEP1GSC050_0623 [Leptospira broomii serovar Hurstbridge str. 5399]|uniref:Uncharacterized protein n=1 Tax=Leptospira broomii serovar Hurstbridge str. 5399 TaxID=1049789 RepID=T0FH74_9LEPT|nr:hypothetical protein LEP1GSC050_0623 [Leptospira broomii serovar Hurstbridge str. 5399]